ncbi:Dihydrolipoyl dehydrogenase [bacterium HR10]|nr:Dihydrolipoyl dehydrogenase [bacterium HR10]
MERTSSTQLAVVGSGPGGYVAAFRAADAGLSVTLIGQEPAPGGICLHVGCIPSKALLHVARVLAEVREAQAWGITFPPPRVDLERLRAWKRSVVERLTGGLRLLAEQRGVRYLRGRARLLDARTLQVETDAGEAERVSFQHAILATGSRPAELPGVSFASPRIMDSTRALELEDIPRTLLVIGGGYIGLELGTVYAHLGARVTLVEMMPGILPGVDRDLASVLARRLETLFEAVLVKTTVAEMREEAEGVRVRLEGVGGQAVPPPTERVFDKVLVCVGRKPNAHELGLECTRVERDARGFIRVNAERRTSEPTIFAIGDVVGEPMLAHKAMHEARVAIEAITGRATAFEPRAIPAVVFTDPEIAWCGLTETQARQENRPITVARFPWAASGRAVTIDRPEGVTKLILDPETERVLGVGIVGVGAGELIAEGVLAIEMGARASDLERVIHPHPTLSETLMEAAEAFLGVSPHLYRRRTAQR